MIEKHFREWIKKCFEDFDGYLTYEDTEILDYLLNKIGWTNIRRNLKGMIITINGKQRRINKINLNYVEIDNIEKLSKGNFSGIAALELMNVQDSLMLSFSIDNSGSFQMYASDTETDDEVEIIKDGKIVL